MLRVWVILTVIRSRGRGCMGVWVLGRLSHHWPRLGELVGLARRSLWVGKLLDHGRPWSEWGLGIQVLQRINRSFKRVSAWSTLSRVHSSIRVLGLARWHGSFEELDRA